MKKLLSLAVCLVLFIGLFTQPVLALTNSQTTDYLCKDSFLKKYHSVEEYKEIYVHYADEEDKDSADWVFLFARKHFAEPMSRCRLVGERILFTDSGYSPFTFGYCVYDVKTDTFTGIADLIGSSDADNYKGLAEYWESSEYGRPLGDADGDKKLSVLDSTYIQMVLVGLYEFSPADDLTDYIFVGASFVSDYDRDGNRTILDATAIQKKLAQVE